MSLQELIQKGWADHADKTAEVADRLEGSVELVEDAKGAVSFMSLVNHAVGDHLGDRDRALRLSEAAYARAQDDDDTSPLVYLAVARRLAGQTDAAAEAQAGLGDDPGNGIRVSMLVAQGLMHGGDWDGADGLYRETLATSESLPEGHAGERATAVVSNNIVAESLPNESRTDAQNALMETAAHASKKFWLRVGTWVNEERAEYTLACVHTALGRHADALSHAERGLAVIAENGDEPVDQAFLHLARATAHRDLGDAELQAADIAAAEKIAEGFEADWIKSWFAEELAKAK